MDRLAVLQHQNRPMASSMSRKRGRAGRALATQEMSPCAKSAKLAGASVPRPPSRDVDDDSDDYATQDSTATVFMGPDALCAAPDTQQGPADAAVRCEAHSSCAHDSAASAHPSTSGPCLEGRYIHGTRLLVDGWFQGCRGCNEPTVHTTPMAGRDVPLCPRCRTKFGGMANGSYPQGCNGGDASIEPLCYWLPKLLPPMPPLTAYQRRRMCEQVMLRQDDAWAALVRASL